jgi:hypothetical protein
MIAQISRIKIAKAIRSYNIEPMETLLCDGLDQDSKGSSGSGLGAEIDP